MSDKPNFVVRFEEVQRIDVQVVAKSVEEARIKAYDQLTDSVTYRAGLADNLITEKTVVKQPRVASKS